jgi:hypothetical protein
MAVADREHAFRVHGRNRVVEGLVDGDRLAESLRDALQPDRFHRVCHVLVLGPR